MCGRYYVEIDEDELRDIWGEAEKMAESLQEPLKFKARGEIFPTDVVPVQTGVGKYAPMKWGFINFDKKTIINARSETALQKPMFRKPMLESRCLVPASGYYEWRKEADKKTKYQFYTPGRPIFMAGCFRREKDSPVNHFVILTRQAVNGLEVFHDRMPVIIPDEYADAWLNDSPKVIDSALLELAYSPAA